MSINYEASPREPEPEQSVQDVETVQEKTDQILQEMAKGLKDHTTELQEIDPK
jgi:hypothetical protein